MSSLESLWKEGRKGALCPLEQMRAWALRAAQRDLLGGEDAVNYAAIADRVTKVGGGHPGREAIRQFLDRVDEDPDWYPGKNYRKRRQTWNERAPLAPPRPLPVGPPPAQRRRVV